MKTECPLCGVQIYESHVPTHVINSHLGVFVAGRGLLMHESWSLSGERHVAYLCWCGRFCTDDIAIREHWREAGGVLAHILELTLGGNDARG